MKRTLNITFVDGYGWSEFGNPVFSRCVKESMRSTNTLTHFELYGNGGRVIYSHNGIVKPNYECGDKLAFCGIVREDDFTGVPLPETISKLNKGSRPIIEVHRNSGLYRCYYPAHFQTFEPYEGRVYEQFKSDCWALCREFLFDEFNIETPAATLELCTELSNRLGQDYMLESIKNMANMVEVLVPKRGDVIVINIGGMHSLMYLGDDKALHITPSRFSAIVDIKSVWDGHGEAVILRHKSLL